jgi:hypothetical protein
MVNVIDVKRKKDERLQVLQTIIEQEDFPMVWYDGRKNEYVIEDLLLNYQKEYHDEIKHWKTR